MKVVVVDTSRADGMKEEDVVVEVGIVENDDARFRIHGMMVKE